MGHVKKRGEIYWGFWTDHRGAYRRESLKTRDAKVAKERLRERELHGTSAIHSTETLGDALDYLLQIAMAADVPETRESYGQKARWLKAVLGPDRRVKDIDRELLLRYVDRRLSPVQPVEPGVPQIRKASLPTIYKEFVVLRRALTEAKGRGLWDGDLDALVPKIKGESKPRDRWLELQEFHDLYEQLPPKRARYLVLCCFQGPRDGEVQGTSTRTGISWSDCDFTRGVLRIRGGKTEGSYRNVPLAQALEEELLDVPPEDRHGLLVEPWPNVVRDLKVACRRIGIPPVTPNDLRRTFCSWMLQAGVPIFTVKELMGHGSTRMIERVYGRLNLKTLLSAGDELCRFVHDAGAKEGVKETYETQWIVPKTANDNEVVVSPEGFEPSTIGLKVRWPWWATVFEPSGNNTVRA